MNLSPALRQIIVAVSAQLAALSVGGVVGYPGVLLQQFGHDRSIEIDMNTSSWMGSIHGLAGIPSILMPAIMQWKGRKFAFTIACLIITIGWAIATFARTVPELLISELFHGLGTNSILAVSLLSMSEMVTPKYRNVSMLSFSIVQSLGMASVGIMARYLHWRTIGIVMSIPMVLALLASFIWTESPSWLACKGEFEKCEQAFLCLRGSDEKSKRELYELINAQKELLDRNLERATLSNTQLFFGKVSRRDFYLPSIHMFLLLNAMYWSGLMVIIIYSVQMLKQLTRNQNAAHIGSIVNNSILFFCNTITGFLVRRYNHKPVLLTSLFFTTICLIVTSAVAFSQSVGLLANDSLICLYCLIAYMVCSSLGLNSIVFTVAAELMPVKHRGLGGALFVIYTCLLHTTSLKISPYLFLYLDMWGTFLLYAINGILSTIFVWKFMPETKGRTLQEIEDFYSGGKFSARKSYEECETFNVKT